MKKFSAWLVGVLHYSQILSLPWGISVKQMLEIDMNQNWYLLCVFSACWSKQEINFVEGLQVLFHGPDSAAFT
jgi:hypothetical protein